MLKRQPKGGLVVSCGVASVEIEVDGSKIGKTDQIGRLYLETIEAGTHTVKLLHPKYLPLETKGFGCIVNVNLVVSDHLKTSKFGQRPTS